MSPSIPVGASTTTGLTVSSGPIDGCLIGHWIENGELDRLSVRGTEIESMGGAGTTLSFTAAGREVADYSASAPLQGSNNGVVVVVTQRGTVSFHVTTGSSELTFLKADYSGYSAHETFGGQAVDLPRPQLPPPDFYQCSPELLTENANGYRAEYHRG